MTATALPPALPLPTRSPSTRTWVIITTIALLAVAALAVANATVATNNATEAPRLAAPTVCDPSTATAYPNGRTGVAVYVNAPGPDVVTVNVAGGHDYAFRLVQQVPKRYGGARFDFGNTWGTHTISVTTNHLGTCQIPVPAGANVAGIGRLIAQS